MKNVLYVFSGEKAQGAEIVIERLMAYNTAHINTHLFISPGDFAHQLMKADKPYKISMVDELRRLFRNKTNGFSFYLKAVRNHFKVSYKVYRYLKKEQIDIVHANNIVATAYLIPVLLYTKLFLRKKIWIWSDHDMGYASKIDKTISKIAVRLYDCTLVVSAAVSKKYRGNNKVEVLYNGLDTAVFKLNIQARKDFRTNLNLPDNAVLLGMAGKIIPGKGHLGLIEVFNRLTPVFPNAYLILAGNFSDDNPDHNDKVKQAMAANNNIIYLGFLNDITAYYNGCDIIISNSDNKMSESLGTTIYEAMAFEKIVVASGTGGSAEIISDGIDGFLFEAESKAGLLDKLTLTLKNQPLNPVIGMAAREKVKNKFNISTMAQQYNNILNMLVKSV